MLRVVRFCSACFLVDGFKDANSSWGTSDMFASKSGDPSRIGGESGSEDLDASVTRLENCN